MTVHDLNPGDFCRLRVGTPARYLGWGLAIAICSQDNEPMVGRAALADEESTNLPLPTNREVMTAIAAVRVARGLP